MRWDYTEHIAQLPGFDWDGFSVLHSSAVQFKTAPVGERLVEMGWGFSRGGRKTGGGYERRVGVVEATGTCSSIVGWLKPKIFWALQPLPRTALMPMIARMAMMKTTMMSSIRVNARFISLSFLLSVFVDQQPVIDVERPGFSVLGSPGDRDLALTALDDVDRGLHRQVEVRRLVDAVVVPLKGRSGGLDIVIFQDLFGVVGNGDLRQVDEHTIPNDPGGGVTIGVDDRHGHRRFAGFLDVDTSDVGALIEVDLDWKPTMAAELDEVAGELDVGLMDHVECVITDRDAEFFAFDVFLICVHEVDELLVVGIVHSLPAHGARRLADAAADRVWSNRFEGIVSSAVEVDVIVPCRVRQDAPGSRNLVDLVVLGLGDRHHVVLVADAHVHVPATL